MDGEDGRERASGVLAWVVGRDGEELSATGTRARNLSAADHLGVLYATWEAETTAARAHYHAGLLHDALPDRFRGEPGHKAKWLWRTLHAAELVGWDPADLLADAVAGPDLTGDRDIAAVLDARIRRRPPAAAQAAVDPAAAAHPQPGAPPVPHRTGGGDD